MPYKQVQFKQLYNEHYNFLWNMSEKHFVFKVNSYCRANVKIIPFRIYFHGSEVCNQFISIDIRWCPEPGTIDIPIWLYGKKPSAWTFISPEQIATKLHYK